MRIENQRHCVKLRRDTSGLETVSTWIREHLNPCEYPLRFAIVAVENNEAVIEVTMLNYGRDRHRTQQDARQDTGQGVKQETEEYSEKYTETLKDIEILNPRKKAYQASSFGVVQIIPTGILCEIGGFAGDACPVTNLLAATADFLVTHPNAVNASELNEMAANVLYVEGKALDDFLLGHLGLMPVTSHKIGTFVDRSGIDYLDDVVNTLNAGRAVKGLDCGLYTVLQEALDVKIDWTASGCAVGTILRPTAILEAVDRLIAHGATAVGGVSVIHGVTQAMFAQHLQGRLPNPSGGVEAIITHLISKIFRIPTAHAPLPYYHDSKTKTTDNPRASAEFISTPHYFCVLKGLAKAPRLMTLSSLDHAPSHLITVNHIGAIIVPASCLGGVPALVAEYSGIPLIAVRENQTVLNVTPDKMQMANVIEVNSYLEAAGVVVALREGIALDSVRRPIHCVQAVY
jgi:hypothetical protein